MAKRPPYVICTRNHFIYHQSDLDLYKISIYTPSYDLTHQVELGTGNDQTTSAAVCVESGLMCSNDKFTACGYFFV